jgi:hypothetical protein
MRTFEGASADGLRDAESGLSSARDEPSRDSCPQLLIAPLDQWATVNSVTTA